MYKVYVLRNIKGDRLYIGFTDDIKRRLAEHNSGKTKSTKEYGPWEVVYVEEVNTIKEAREREKYLKSGSAREKLYNKFRSRSSTE